VLELSDPAIKLPEFYGVAVYQSPRKTLGFLVIVADDLNAITDMAVIADDVGVISDRSGYVGVLSPDERSPSLICAPVSA
jgi:hypothetical protein